MPGRKRNHTLHRMGGGTEMIAEENRRNTYNPTWDWSRAVTGMRLELLADSLEP